MTKAENKHEDIKDLSFEDALKELETIVRDLEAGGQALDASIEHYTRGTALRSHCEKKLVEAKMKVEKIVADGEKATGTEPLEVD